MRKHSRTVLGRNVNLLGQKRLGGWHITEGSKPGCSKWHERDVILHEAEVQLTWFSDEILIWQKGREYRTLIVSFGKINPGLSVFLTSISPSS